MSKKVTKEDHNKIRRLYKIGWTQRKLADRFKLSQGYICDIIKNEQKDIKLDKIKNPEGNYKTFKNYRVFSSGKVWNTTTKKWLKLYYNKGGYPMISFGKSNSNSFGTKTKNKLLSRIILTLFIRPAKPGEAARHLDGIPKNTYLSNLAWGTYKENEEDKTKHGTRIRGENFHSAVLTLKQVKIIKKEWLETDESKSKFADYWSKKLNIGKHNILNILYEATWKWVKE